MSVKIELLTWLYKNNIKVTNLIVDNILNENITTALHHLKCIKSLKIRTLDEGKYPDIELLLLPNYSEIKALREISLDNHNGASDFTFLTKLITNCPYLEILIVESIDRCNSLQSFFEQINSPTSTYESLRHFSLKNKPPAEADMSSDERVMLSIQDMMRSTNIDRSLILPSISNLPVNDKMIITMIQKCTLLHTLYIDHNKLTDALFIEISKCLPHLQHIGVMSSRVTDKGYLALTKHCMHINAIEIKGN